MEVVIHRDADAAADTAASIVSALVRRRPQAVIGLATGSTPLRTYARLIDARRDGLDVSGVRMVALDEYIGLPPGHPQSYRTFLLDRVMRPLGLPDDGLHMPDVHAEDLTAACVAFEREIAELGGVDLQLLGIGGNGHIGFNEPSSSLASRTRPKTLHPRTLADNARFFADGDDVPRHVITQGIGTIRECRHALLLATGEHKAEAVAFALEGPVSAMAPASALQLHPHTTVLIDEAAASKLRLTEYYRHTHEHKPTWQPY